jgi:hypothetical protein
MTILFPYDLAQGRGQNVVILFGNIHGDQHLLGYRHDIGQ